MSKRFFESACNELLQTIREYDSDTFFAKGCNLTEEEAYEIAGRLIHNMIDNELDGVRLDCLLENVRGL